MHLPPPVDRPQQVIDRGTPLTKISDAAINLSVYMDRVEAILASSFPSPWLGKFTCMSQFPDRRSQPVKQV